MVIGVSEKTCTGIHGHGAGLALFTVHISYLPRVEKDFGLVLAGLAIEKGLPFL